MHAITYRRYGSPDNLQWTDLPRPEPRAGEVLVRIGASSVNALEWRLLRGQPYLFRLAWGLFRPRNNRLGADLAGRVVAVGEGVADFQVGDRVFGSLSAAGFGAFAEYARVPERLLVAMPESATYEQAACLPVAGAAALAGLRDRGKLQPGEEVLIYGASGGVGAFAVQIAKAMGGEVTAVCSTGKVEQSRQLGADHVIDYTQTDLRQSERRYDLILGINGYLPLGTYRQLLKPGGRYVMVGGGMRQIFEAVAVGGLFSRRDKRITVVSGRAEREHFATLRDLLAEGKIKPLIERVFPLPQAAEAVRQVEQGHVGGKLVISVRELD